MTLKERFEKWQFDEDWANRGDEMTEMAWWEADKQRRKLDIEIINKILVRFFSNTSLDVGDQREEVLKLVKNIIDEIERNEQ